MTPPIEIPLRSARSLANLLVATVAALAVGVAAVVGELVGTHSVAERVVGVGLGAVLLVAGAVFGLATVVAARRRTLVVDTEGLRWRTARGGWQVRWAELATVAVHVGQSVGNRGRRQRIRVHLVLTAADPGFRARHHEFDHLRGAFTDSAADRIGIPLANRGDLVEPLDTAVRTFAGERYRGVVDDGRLTRPGYRPEPGERSAW